MRITADDLDGNVPQQEPSYQRQSQSAGGGMDTRIGKWNNILSEINQLMSQAQQMGLVQTQQPAQPQAQAQAPAQAQGAPQSGSQPPPSPEGSGQEPAPSQDVTDQNQVDQAFQQAVGMIQMLQQEPDLGPDATLDDTEGWLMENEQEVKATIREFMARS